MIRAALLLAIALPASAQDLYETPTDPRASFVRIVAPGETLAVIGGKSLDAFMGGVTPFIQVAPGPISVSVGQRDGDGEIAPASFYTFTPGPDGALIQLQDQITNSPAKADLVFYNDSDLALVDLYVPAVKAMAIKDVAPRTSRVVTLKAPLALDFEIQAQGVTLASLTDVKMQRRSGVTVVFSGQAGAYAVFATQNTYAK